MPRIWDGLVIAPTHPIRSFKLWIALEEIPRSDMARLAIGLRSRTLAPCRIQAARIPPAQPSPAARETTPRLDCLFSADFFSTQSNGETRQDWPRAGRFEEIEGKQACANSKCISAEQLALAPCENRK
jgi:hypothetical protein